jgi:hypothetical protein
MFRTIQKSDCFTQQADGIGFSESSNNIRYKLTLADTLTKHAGIRKPTWLSRVGILPDGQTHNLTSGFKHRGRSCRELRGSRPPAPSSARRCTPRAGLCPLCHRASAPPRRTHTAQLGGPDLRAEGPAQRRLTDGQRPQLRVSLERAARCYSSAGEPDAERTAAALVKRA